jgi:hypothetical protein
MNQPPVELFHTFNCGLSTLTSLSFSIAFICSGVKVTKAGVRVAPGNISACACSTLRYTVARTGAATTRAATGISRRRDCMFPPQK